MNDTAVCVILTGIIAVGVVQIVKSRRLLAEAEVLDRLDRETEWDRGIGFG